MNDYAAQERKPDNGNHRRFAVDVLEIRAEEPIYYSVFATTVREVNEIISTMPVTRRLKLYKI